MNLSIVILATQLIGVKFNECDPFLLQFRFQECQLNFSSFYQLKIPKTVFNCCNLEEVDFTESMLQNTVFEKCDLKNAIFDRTNLEKVDFTTAFNLDINPQENNLKGAKFNKQNVVGLVSIFKVIVE